MGRRTRHPSDNQAGTQPLRKEHAPTAVPSGEALEHVPGDFNCADIATKGWGCGKPGTENQRAALWRTHADFCLGNPASHGIHGSKLGATPPAVAMPKLQKAHRAAAPAAALFMDRQ